MNEERIERKSKDIRLRFFPFHSEEAREKQEDISMTKLSQNKIVVWKAYTLYKDMFYQVGFWLPTGRVDVVRKYM